MLEPAQMIEALAAGANLLYVILLIREKILCWPFGIAGSLLSVYLFIDARLYSESLLYVFYAAMGVWGWLRWHRREEQADNPIVMWRATKHTIAITLASSLALAMGYAVQQNSDAARPFFDAFTTSFSFLATYMQVTKVLEAWVYWLCINLASIWLYQDRDLDIYAALIALYSVLSVIGFWQWRQSCAAQSSAAA